MFMLPAPVKSGFSFGRVAVAAASLAALAGLLPRFSPPEREARPRGYLLELTVEEEDRCAYYGSQWNHASSVRLDHDASDGAKVVFQLRFPFVDGCWWESTETLTPVSPREYRYFYSDRLITCELGARPGTPSVRSGRVTVVPFEK